MEIATFIQNSRVCLIFIQPIHSKYFIQVFVFITLLKQVTIAIYKNKKGKLSVSSSIVIASSSRESPTFFTSFDLFILQPRLPSDTRAHETRKKKKLAINI